jgi:hypothetical protein
MAPVRLAGSVLGNHRHACAFFHSKDEEYEVLAPFLAEGLERGEKAFHIVDPQLREDHVRRLASLGIDVEGSEKTGQLEVRRWEDAYLQHGHFNQSRMLALIEEVLSQGKSQGYAQTRLWANMEWALEDRAGVEDIVEYETRLNLVLPRYCDPVVCTYDLSRFDASVVMDVMRTHPVVIIGGILQENPFFVPPEEMLREIRSRARRASTN